VWAHQTERQKQVLEQGDVEEALGAAAAVGDDRIQMQTQGYVVPESFTHGSAEQRVRWFKRGFQSGSIDSCDTFSG
jgi:predicted metalloprotease